MNHNSTKLFCNYINSRQALGTNSEKASMELAEKVLQAFVITGFSYV